MSDQKPPNYSGIDKVDTGSTQTVTGAKTLSDLTATVFNLGVNSRRFFVQDATPTANAADDLWYETDTNLLWFWNGTYWLSVDLYYRHVNNLQNVSAGTNDWYAAWQIAGANDIYLVDFIASTLISTTNDGSNYWTFTFYRTPSFTSLGAFNTSADTVATWYEKAVAVNTHIDVSALTDKSFDVRGGVTGAPGTVNGEVGFTFRLAHV